MRYSDQHIEIYKSLAAGSQNREVQWTFAT